ncbi:MAG: hypothetical protein H8D34_24475 [Chloroflexi bacterium]|nr:hypothetical protein [Chloroflexota bacterium]
MNLKSNSFYSIATGAIILIAVASLAYVTPPLGIFLLLCSSVPVLLLAISAIQWAVREKNGLGIAVPAAAALVLAYGVLLNGYMPDDTGILTLDDLEQVRIGLSYEEIAGEIGGGDWLSDAEFFTVAYEVEGEMQLVLVFEDDVHLSGAILHYPDGKTATMGAAPALGTAGQ